MGIMHYKPNCFICQRTKHDRDFRARFYNTTYYNPEGKESMADIIRDLTGQVSSIAIYNHARKHAQWHFRKRSDQDETIKQYRGRKQKEQKALAVLKKVAPEKVIVVEGEVMVDESAEKQEDWKDILDNLIKAGSKDLEKGRIKVNATQLTTLLKIKADMELKGGSGQDDFLKIVAAAAMGKNGP